MNQSFDIDGAHLVHSLFENTTIHALRDEFTRLSMEAGSACVRHVFDRSDTIRKFATSTTLLDILPDGLQPVRCILFDKTPESNWPVAWHQDLTIAVKEKHDTPGYLNWSTKDGVTHAQPPIELLEKMVTVRIHLDDTPAENGALKVITGSHLQGRIPSDQIQNLTKGNTSTCSCSAGDVLLMKPLILHASERSVTPAHRRVVHIEYADRSALADGLEWHDKV